MEERLDVGGGGQAPQLGGRARTGQPVDLGRLGVGDRADEQRAQAAQPLQQATAALRGVDQQDRAVARRARTLGRRGRSSDAPRSVRRPRPPSQRTAEHPASRQRQNRRRLHQLGGVVDGRQVRRRQAPAEHVVAGLLQAGAEQARPSCSSASRRSGWPSGRGRASVIARPVAEVAAADRPGREQQRRGQAGRHQVQEVVEARGDLPEVLVLAAVPDHRVQGVGRAVGEARPGARRARSRAAAPTMLSLVFSASDSTAALVSRRQRPGRSRRG